MLYRFEPLLIAISIILLGLFTYFFPGIGILFILTIVSATYYWQKKVREEGDFLQQNQNPELYSSIQRHSEVHDVFPIPGVLLQDTETWQSRLIQALLGPRFIYLPLHWAQESAIEEEKVEAFVLPQIGSFKAGQHAYWRRFSTSFGRILPWLGNALAEAERLSAEQVLGSGGYNEEFNPHWGFSRYSQTLFEGFKKGLAPFTQKIGKKLLQISTPTPDDGAGKGVMMIALGILWYLFLGNLVLVPLRLLGISYSTLTFISPIASIGPALLSIILGVRYQVKYQGLTKLAQLELSYSVNHSSKMENSHTKKVVNKVINVPMTGGIIGMLGVSPKKTLQNHITRENQNGWRVNQVMDAASGNLFLLVLRMFLLIITLLLYTTSNGYYLILEKEVDMETSGKKDDFDSSN